MKKPDYVSPDVDERTAAGASLYSKWVLFFYDFFVCWFSNNFVWKCLSQFIMDHYNKHVTNNHLEVGVGTGYFPNRCRFPSSHPAITLADINSDALQFTAQRLARYHPKIITMNVLEPLSMKEHTFDSIGMNYVLHVLPGTMDSKSAALKNLKMILKPGGVLFGSTILGRGVQAGRLARLFRWFYNKKKILTNLDDSPEGLEKILKENFSEWSMEVIGCVGIFSGRKADLEGF